MHSSTVILRRKTKTSRRAVSLYMDLKLHNLKTEGLLSWTLSLIGLKIVRISDEGSPI